MADEPSTTDASTTDAAASGSTFTQAQVNDLIAKEKGKIQAKYADHADLKTAAQELAAIRAAQQSDSEEFATVKTDAEKTKAENLRLRVALETKLPGDLIDRLQGSTKEEMLADAAKLLELVNPTPSLDGGAREPSNEGSFDDQIRRAFAR